MTRSRLGLLLSRALRSLWFRPMVFAAAALGVVAVAPSVATLLPGGPRGRRGVTFGHVGRTSCRESGSAGPRSRVLRPIPLPRPALTPPSARARPFHGFVLN